MSVKKTILKLSVLLVTLSLLVSTGVFPILADTTPPPPPPGGGGTLIDGTGYYTLDGNVDTMPPYFLPGTLNGISYFSPIVTGVDNQSGVKVVNHGVLKMNNFAVVTSGDSTSMDSSSFGGLNAGVLAKSGSTITMNGGSITTTGTGANGAYATDHGTTFNLTNVSISCAQEGGHGIDATGGASITANNVNVVTRGDGASAAIATDRGGGTILVNGGTFTTYGSRSPGIYSTGNITVENATLKAYGSEAAAMDGKNSITLVNSNLTGSVSWGIGVFQTVVMAPPSETADVTMQGGSLKAETGPLFFASNTNAVFDTDGASFLAKSGIILQASTNSMGWGTPGENGADVVFKASNEALKGNVVCDDISTIDMTLENTMLRGAINTDNTAKSMTLTLGEGSVWNVTGNSYLSSLSDYQAIPDNIHSSGYRIALTNIHSHGYNVYYDSSNPDNSWLGGQTYTLAGGGKLTPMS